MFMSLLPGIRDLRAPLAAGYLWIAFAWVCVFDRVPGREQASGLLGGVYELADDLGTGPTLIIVSFIAYLLGAVLAVTGMPPLSALRSVAGDGYWRLVRGQLSRETIDQIKARVQQVREAAFQRPLPEPDASIAAASPIELELPSSGGPGLAQAVSEYNAAGVDVPSGPHSWPTAVWESFPWRLADGLLRESEQLVTRLRLESQALFDEYDRARGEAELRLSVAPPIAALALALGIRWSGWFALGVIGAAALMYSGLGKARQARDVLAQACLAGTVTPTLWVNADEPSLQLHAKVLRAFTDREQPVPPVLAVRVWVDELMQSRTTVG